MKKPSRAGGGRPSKARSRRSSRLKRNIESKTTAPRSAATRQVGEWLENLGMSEYAQRFAKNGIDFSVLPHPTDQDLKDIGVLLGHRRKMLAAISAIWQIRMHPPGGPWAKDANGRSPQDGQPARFFLRLAWAVNSKRNQAAGTRNESSSTAMFLKLNTRWPLGANPRSRRTAPPAPPPAEYYFPSE
jgi:SAM domain (Sterile alpha motif)